MWSTHLSPLPWIINTKTDIWEYNNDCEEDRTGKKTSLEQSKVKEARQGIGVKLGKLPRESIAWFS